jgi:hypothetical protein
VKWAVITTGRGGGSHWAGFAAALEVSGKSGQISRAVLNVLKGPFKPNYLPAPVEAAGGTVCACQWQGSIDDMKTADAAFLETSQDMCVVCICWP